MHTFKCLPNVFDIYSIDNSITTVRLDCEITFNSINIASSTSKFCLYLSHLNMTPTIVSLGDSNFFLILTIKLDNLFVKYMTFKHVMFYFCNSFTIRIHFNIQQVYMKYTE